MSELQGVIVGQTGLIGHLQIVGVLDRWWGPEPGVEVRFSRVSV